MMKIKQGFTLIEFMISMALMALVSVMSFYALTTAKQMSENARLRLLAANAARSVLEQVKSTGLANVASLNTSSYIPAALPSGSISVATNPTNVTGATLATVTVTVSWRGPANRPEQLRISTMRSVY